MEDSGNGQSNGQGTDGGKHELKGKRFLDIDMSLEDVIAQKRQKGKNNRNQDRNNVRKPISKQNNQNRRPDNNGGNNGGNNRGR